MCVWGVCVFVAQAIYRRVITGLRERGKRRKIEKETAIV